MIAALCNRLKNIFGPRHTVDHYRGELTNIYQGINEHVLDYISRVKDLRTAIIDCNRHTADTAEIDTLVS
ncbi:hypothetical protein WH47_02493 [Habropoda laboriosa]|uniref:Uncharacterized protein n=1 Tax=Habropoda laboriosa TaxID=597456 RepID=A0A0L7QYF0_9HYME|nr:hypothetical protein WH47_02493 [Habropoda laboriosa]